MQVFFDSRRELAPAIWQYDFRPERPVDFVPGQYVDLHLPAAAGDPRGAMRTLTITSLPSDPTLSFIIKATAPASIYKRTLAGLQPGAGAKIDSAMGDLILPKDPAQPLAFIAGGIGIASFAAMLRDLTARREERPVFLFYSLRQAREQLFRELTGAYPLSLKTVVIAPNRLTAQAIRDTTPPNALLYLSGSQRFVESLRASLEHSGTPRSQIVFDFFDGYAEL